MEAYITPPDALRHADPLTRLLAAILEWLRALLAEHQAAQLPPTPTRRASARETAELSVQPALTAKAPAPAPVLSRPHAVRPRDMSAGIPRPRPVAPH